MVSWEPRFKAKDLLSVLNFSQKQTQGLGAGGQESREEWGGDPGSRVQEGAGRRASGVEG